MPMYWKKSHLIWAECLLEMCVFEESCNGQDIGSRVHLDEEEHTSQVQAGQVRVVLHDLVQERGHLLHQDGVKGQQELEDHNKGHPGLWCKMAKDVET